MAVGRILGIEVISLLIGILLSSALINYSLLGIEITSTPAGPNNNKTEKSRIITRSLPLILANQIDLSTDEQTYKPGETINITLRNFGTQPLRLSNTNTDIRILNLDNGNSLVPPILLRSSLIPRGSSITIPWDQQDYTSQQVRSGNYSVLISVGSLKANSSFAILEK